MAVTSERREVVLRINSNRIDDVDDSLSSQSIDFENRPGGQRDGDTHFILVLSVATNYLPALVKCLGAYPQEDVQIVSGIETEDKKA